VICVIFLLTCTSDNNPAKAGGDGTPDDSTAMGCDSTQDFDGDSLNDCAEMNVYGTSWRIADTDGDGLSDKYEVMEANFNPLIAEMPLLDIDFTSSPYIHLTAQETNVDEELLSTQMSKSFAQNVSSSRTVSSNTQTMME